MTQSAWGPPQPQPQVKGPEPGSYLKVPIVAVMDEAASQALFEQLRAVARDAIAAGLADAIGDLNVPASAVMPSSGVAQPGAPV
jgi:hypothetical protein